MVTLWTALHRLYQVDPGLSICFQSRSEWCIYCKDTLFCVPLCFMWCLSTTLVCSCVLPWRISPGFSAIKIAVGLCVIRYLYDQQISHLTWASCLYGVGPNVCSCQLILCCKETCRPVEYACRPINWYKYFSDNWQNSWKAYCHTCHFLEDLPYSQSLKNNFSCRWGMATLESDERTLWPSLQTRASFGDTWKSSKQVSHWALAWRASKSSRDFYLCIPDKQERLPNSEQSIPGDPASLLQTQCPGLPPMLNTHNTELLW